MPLRDLTSFWDDEREGRGRPAMSMSKDKVLATAKGAMAVMKGGVDCH